MAEAAAVASVASIASVAGGGLSSIMKGYGTASADEAAAQRAQRAAMYGKLAAQESDVKFRDELNTTLGNIEVIRSAAKIDPSSPTSAAILDRQTQLSERQRRTAGLNIQAQIDQDLADAAYLHKAGQYAIGMGFLNAGVGVTGALGKGYSGGTLKSAGDGLSLTGTGGLY